MHDDSSLDAILPTLLGKIRFIGGRTPLPVVHDGGASDTIPYPDLRATVVFENGFGLLIKTVFDPPPAQDRTPMMAAVDELDFPSSTFCIIPFMCGMDGKKQSLPMSFYEDILSSSDGLFSASYTKREWEMADVARVDHVLHFLAHQPKRLFPWLPHVLQGSDVTYFSAADVAETLGHNPDEDYAKLLRTSFGSIDFHPVTISVPANAFGRQGAPIRCQGWSGGMLFANGFAIELTALEHEFRGLSPSHPSFDRDDFQSSKFRLRLLAKTDGGLLGLVPRDEVDILRGLWHDPTMVHRADEGREDLFAVGVFDRKQVETLAAGIMFMERHANAAVPLNANYGLHVINHFAAQGSTSQPY